MTENTEKSPKTTKITTNHHQHPPTNQYVPQIWFLVTICINYKVCQREVLNSKKLVPLKHLVKLRKSCEQMILPDIRKCSNLVQNMVANRYSCFWGLGAIWQPLWLKNSHNMAIFHHFLTFLVTFLVAMTSFMHKTCTERTETFLIHRTIDEVPFLPFPGTYPGVQGSKKWLFYG